MKRRTFIAGASILGTINLKNMSSKYLVHHAIFWLKNPNSEADRNKLIEGLNTLKSINYIQELHIGIIASTEKREVVDTTWQVSEIMFFKDIKDQKAYQDDPIHQAFVKNYSYLWEKVLVYDAQDI